MKVRALIFDVDGTLAETEDLHRISFNEAFEDMGIAWTWDRELYRKLLKTTGGRDRISEYARDIGADAIDAAALHARKTEIYNGRIREGLVTLRPGVEALIRRAREDGIALAIATTTSRLNVLSLLSATLGLGSAEWFTSIRTGEDVREKKPDPEVFNLVLSDLSDIPVSECLCFEDSRNGLLASRAAGLRTIITPSIYSEGEDFAGADLIIRNLSQPWSSAEFKPYSSLLDQPASLSRLLLGLHQSSARSATAG